MITSPIFNDFSGSRNRGGRHPESKCATKGDPVQGVGLPPPRTPQHVRLQRMREDHPGLQPGRGQPPLQQPARHQSGAVLQDGLWENNWYNLRSNIKCSLNRDLSCVLPFSRALVRGLRLQVPDLLELRHNLKDALCQASQRQPCKVTG